MRKKLFLGLALALAAASPAHAETDWKRVDEVLGRPGADQPGGVYKFGLPRTDLKVTLDGVEIKPALALGSWLAFQPAGGEAMVMGDLVLTQEEVNPVMKQPRRGRDRDHRAAQPPAARPARDDVHARRGPRRPGQARRRRSAPALERSGTPLGAPAAAGARAGARIDLDTAAIERALGRKGNANGRVYQVSDSARRAGGGRRHGGAARDGLGRGDQFPAPGEGKAATTGDFVLTAEEVNPVLRALREHGIEVTALHNHMLDDQPRLFFMHFWGVDAPEKLAEGLKAALDKVAVKMAGG